MLSVGEASGDLHASELIKALRVADRDARFCFLGGDLMAEAAGTKPAVHYRDMAYMGFTQVVKHLPDIRRNYDVASRLLAKVRPDALILVDYPGFNLKLAAEAHRLGIPCYYYISPKVWAWKTYRVADLRQYCRRVLCIFPFEPEFFEEHDYDGATYVGNPSVEEIDRRLAEAGTAEEFRARHGITHGKPLIAIVPGSRRSEIEGNLRLMLEAARVLRSKYEPVVAGAPGIEPEFYTALTDAKVIFNDTTALMRHSTVAAVTSGTATLECALAGTPQVACYRGSGSRVTYSVMSKVLHIDYVTLPNLIAQAPVIPELLMHRCTPINLLAHLVHLLPGHVAREPQLQGYAEIRRRLGTRPAAATAAAIIATDLNVRP